MLKIIGVIKSVKYRSKSCKFWVLLWNVNAFVKNNISIAYWGKKTKLDFSFWIHTSPFFSTIKDCPNGELVNDGNCNDENNNEDCLFDGDDCCGSCVNTDLCTQCACLGNLTGNGYSNSMIGNGICNDETNTFDCAYDGLDCCGSNATIDHCTDCTCHGK